MKALLLIENDSAADIVRFYLRRLGFESVRYRNPLKALDNLEEIEPDAIVFSARDYPRHWKVIASAVRAQKNKEQCVLILLRGDLFPIEEAAKATELGVNGVVKDNLDDRHEQARFEKLLKRYIKIDDPRAAERLAPSPWDKLDFSFSHPKTLMPIMGKLDTVSQTGVSFAPDNPQLAADLPVGSIIDDCSLRVGDRIFPLSCRLERKGSCLAFSIASMDDKARNYFEQYLRDCPQREMKAMLAGEKAKTEQG